jgi:hypothetical protein
VVLGKVIDPPAVQYQPGKEKLSMEPVPILEAQGIEAVSFCPAGRAKDTSG